MRGKFPTVCGVTETFPRRLAGCLVGVMYAIQKTPFSLCFLLPLHSVANAMLYERAILG